MNQAVLWIVAFLAPLGAFDILYFHIWRFRLFDRPQSRAETVTHVTRSFLLAVMVLLVANFEVRGAWYALLVAAAALDFANDIVDVLLEPASRAALGGLPPLEYLTHIVGAAGSGAAAATAVVLGWIQGGLPTELSPITSLPAALRWNGNAIGVGAILLGLFETALLVGSILRNRRSASVPA